MRMSLSRRGGTVSGHQLEMVRALREDDLLKAWLVVRARGVASEASRGFA